ncbi:MAG: class I SAM-dependent methyltransferase [Candidatus Thorarchaeota archaeon]|jgi:hypothetical protein
MNYSTEVYNTREWFESLTWQHRWIEFMAGWWAGEFGVPRSVIDFGAGDGWWCYAFTLMGSKEPYAVELHNIATEFIPPSVHFIQRDLREPITDGGMYSLVICLEVAEHLPKSAAGTLCSTLVTHTADLLMFSAASPDQPGTGHINLQPQEFWRNQIRRHGKIDFSPPRTGKARAAFKNILPEPFQYLSRNVMVFARI